MKRRFLHNMNKVTHDFYEEIMQLYHERKHYDFSDMMILITKHLEKLDNSTEDKK